MGRYGCLRLFKAYLWVSVPFWKTFINEFDCLEDIYGWVCFSRILNGWVWVDMTVQFKFMGVGVCDCVKHIFGMVCLSKKHLCMNVTV